MERLSLSARLAPAAGTSGLLLAIVVATFSVVACDSTTSNLKDPTVADVASSRSDLTVLAGALQQANLTDDLADRDSSFTLFAPRNTAFETINSEELGAHADLLEEVLSYHVVPGKKITSDNLEDSQPLPTLEDDSVTVTVSGSAVHVNDDTLGTMDLDAANGVVHIVDGVLLEGVDAAHRLLLAPEHQLFSSLVTEAELTAVLSGVGPDGEDGLTVFAPTNEAILAAFDENDDGELDDSEGPANVEAWVKYHVVDDVYPTDEIPSSATDVTTLEGSNVTIQQNDEHASINDAAVSTPDREVENGVVHSIDAALTGYGG